MQVINLTNGNTEILNQPEDIANIVYEYLGYEAYCVVHQLIQKADTEQQKFDTDFRGYEMQVESQVRALQDISEINQILLNYLDDAKRIDRDHIRKLVDENQVTISNQI